MENNLSFKEIFKESLEFFERNVKNIVIGYLVVAVATSVLVFLPQALKSFIASALLVIFIAAVYHADKSKTELSIDTLTTLLKEKFLMVLGLTIVLAIIYSIGTMLLIIPGIYAMVALQFSVWTMIFKPDTKFFDTMSHSHKLTKGRMWQIFLLNLIAGIIIFVFFGIASGIFSLAFGLIGLGSMMSYIFYILTLTISVLAIIFQLFLYLRVEASYKPEA